MKSYGGVSPHKVGHAVLFLNSPFCSKIMIRKGALCILNTANSCHWFNLCWISFKGTITGWKKKSTNIQNTFTTLSSASSWTLCWKTRKCHSWTSKSLLNTDQWKSSTTQHPCQLQQLNIVVAYPSSAGRGRRLVQLRLVYNVYRSLPPSTSLV